MVEPSDNSSEIPSKNSLPPTGEGVVIDIGTGDGLFVYQSARRHPKKFYIGIDANLSQLEKISEKIHRKPARGGAANVLFLQAAVEDLPRELDGLADELHIHFPWGSLLRAVALGDRTVLRELRRVCTHEALLEVIIGLDSVRDQSEFKRLLIPDLTVDHINSVLKPRYRNAGFEITERGERLPSNWPKLHSSWAKRLEVGRRRALVYLIARAITP